MKEALLLIALVLIAIILLNESVTKPKGEMSASPRIIGGYEVKPHSAPFVVHYSKPPDGRCGGTIINEYTILTAAHCAEEDFKYALAGDHNRKIPEPTEQKIQIKERIIHPLYNKSSEQIFDFAIDKLAKPLKFNSAVQPVKLPQKDRQVVEGTPVFAFGWGLNAEEINPDALQGVPLRAMSIEECSLSWGNQIRIESMMCAGGEATRSVNRGDSGGPLVKMLGDTAVLVGVASFVNEGAPLKAPAVFARVGAALDFIRTNM